MVITRKPLKGETYFTDAAGVEDYHEYIFSPVISADGEVEAVCGTTRLITERKRAEAAAEEQRKVLQLIAEDKPLSEILETLVHAVELAIRGVAAAAPGQITYCYRLLPELATRTVMKHMDGPIADTVAAKRPITVRDCLTFQLGYGWALGPPTPLRKAMADAGLGMGPRPAPNEWIKRLGTLPLAHQPGEGITYDTSADVLGVLIARASGQSFADFLKTRLFEPLGMNDAGFSLAPAQIERLASAYGLNPETRKLTLTEDARGGRFASPPAFASGGGGLVATIDDYLAFTRMMLGKGKLDKTRVLSRPSVEAMTRNYLTATQKQNQGLFPAPFELPRTPSWAPDMWNGRGWGFCMMVITEALGPTYSVGRFGWDGGSGVMCWVDPREEMIMLLMVQAPPAELARNFLTLAYQAIDD